jgi:hypothetical protein
MVAHHALAFLIAVVGGFVHLVEAQYLDVMSRLGQSVRQSSPSHDESSAPSQLEIKAMLIDVPENWESYIGYYKITNNPEVMLVHCPP